MAYRLELIEQIDSHRKNGRVVHAFGNQQRFKDFPDVVRIVFFLLHRHAPVHVKPNGVAPSSHKCTTTRCFDVFVSSF